MALPNIRIFAGSATVSAGTSDDHSEATATAALPCPRLCAQPPSTLVHERVYLNRAAPTLVRSDLVVPGTGPG